jgi:Tol biopolymer transport system component
MVGVDGSPPVNLTRTPEVNELYPKVSPDGSKIAFVIDQGKGEATVRSVYYMNFDGTGRTLVATNARWPCWSPDGQAIAYLKQEGERFAYNDPYTKGLVVYDLRSGKHREHPNQAIEHIYNPCLSLDRKWFLATISGGMGYRHTNLAIEAEGLRVIDLGLPGCRLDISPDGKKVAWGASDWTMRVGELDVSGPEPKVIHMRDVVTSSKPVAIYHMDWSPDGKYVAFTRGPIKKRLGPHPAIIGVQAEGWGICVADVSRQDCWVAITTDGKSNKEPDWVPLGGNVTPRAP